MASFKLHRGDTWVRAWVLTDADGVAIDLTGASARLHARDATGAKVAEASTLDGRIIITPAAGRIDMSVPYASMMLAPGAYSFDLEVTHADGTRRTYEAGTLVIREDVTHD